MCAQGVLTNSEGSQEYVLLLAAQRLELERKGLCRLAGAQCISHCLPNQACGLIESDCTGVVSNCAS